MIPILMCVFALGGSTYGMAEESLAFYALVIAVMIAAGYDALTGAAVVLLGCGIGTFGSTINPFATGIASGFAGVSISDGLVLRLIMLVVGLALGIFFVLRYADKVKADPSRSVVANMREENERHFSVDATEGEAVVSGRQKTILAVFGLAFLVMMYGVIPWEDMNIGLPTLWWWFPEMTASFILFSIVIGVIGRMSEEDLTSSFVDGARDLLGVALIIGIARGITVIMNNGKITDTVLNWAEQALGDVGQAAFAVVMFMLFLPLSFLIPSSSGLATVAMPIMSPLAGFADVPAELVVTAFQSASGIMNLFIPTSAVVMGGLAIARVPYGAYLRWVWPLLASLALLSVVGLTAGATAGMRPARSVPHGLADPVEHALLALADQLGLEAHEAALLGRVGGRLGARDQPCAEGSRLLRGRLGRHEGLDLPQLLEHGFSRRLARGLVALERVLPLLCHGLDVERHLGQQLLAARRTGGGLHRRHRLLGGLDRAAGIGQGDGQTGHERCPHDPGPLVLGEIALHGHRRVPSEDDEFSPVSTVMVRMSPPTTRPPLRAATAAGSPEQGEAHRASHR